MVFNMLFTFTRINLFGWQYCPNFRGKKPLFLPQWVSRFFRLSLLLFLAECEQVIFCLLFHACLRSRICLLLKSSFDIFHRFCLTFRSSSCIIFFSSAFYWLWILSSHSIVVCFHIVYICFLPLCVPVETCLTSLKSTETGECLFSYYLYVS